jgi:hypothetical protein
MAMLSLIENTVSVTITQSDSEPIARTAATASCSRVEATGTERLMKPAARCDRVMVVSFPAAQPNQPHPKWIAAVAGNIAATADSIVAKTGQEG